MQGYKQYQNRLKKTRPKSKTSKSLPVKPKVTEPIKKAQQQPEAISKTQPAKVNKPIPGSTATKSTNNETITTQLPSTVPTSEYTTGDVTTSDVKATVPVKIGDSLGSLSAQFESAKKGAFAIGWDRTGGTSYGTYQIATRTGTFKRFLNWCMRFGGKVGKEVATRLMKAGNPDGGKNGPVAKEWIRLASEGKIQHLEHEFIKATHYNVALNRMPPEVSATMTSNKILKDIVWSTAVQHGPGGAAKIISSAYYKSNGDLAKLVKNIYNIRSTKFKSSTPAVRKAVQNRFKKEASIALQHLTSKSSKETTDTSTSSSVKDTDVSSETSVQPTTTQPITTPSVTKPKSVSTPSIPSSIPSTTTGMPKTVSSTTSVSNKISTQSIPTSIPKEDIVKHPKDKSLSTDLTSIGLNQLKVLQHIDELLGSINDNLISSSTSEISNQVQTLDTKDIVQVLNDIKELLKRTTSVDSSVSSTPRPSGAVEDEYQQVPPHTLVSMTKNIVNL